MSNIKEFDFENMFFSDDANAPEILPIISDFDGDLGKFKTPKKLPILPLRNAVLFPGVVVPITVGRETSLKLIKERGTFYFFIISFSEKTIA